MINDKERLRKKAKISIKNYLKKNKTKKDRMEEADIIICQKKKNKY